MEIGNVDGAQVLFLNGRIGLDLPGRLDAILTKHPNIEALHFNSAGGDMTVAMAAGRMLRSRGDFITHVPAGAACLNACALLFLSGRARSVDPGAVFDLERFYDNEGMPSSAANVARQSLSISDYLIRMGVSRRLLTGALDRDVAVDGGAGPRRCLTPAELHSYNVANWNE